jgi:DNA-binding FadR family transcriptional regulator
LPAPTRPEIQLLLARLVNRHATAPELAQHRQLLAVVEEGDPPSAETAI